MPVRNPGATTPRKRPSTQPRAPRAGAEWLCPAEAAHLLALSVITLARWRMAGFGPCWHRPAARIVRYRLADVIAFLGAPVQSTTEADHRAA